MTKLVDNLYRCNRCGENVAVLEYMDDIGYPVWKCSNCGSEDVEPLTRCNRCGELTTDSLCKTCKADIDLAISEALSSVQNTLTGREVSRVEALGFLLDRVEELL